MVCCRGYLTSVYGGIEFGLDRFELAQRHTLRPVLCNSNTPFWPPRWFFWGSLCQKNPCQKIILPILFLEGRIWLFSQISCKFFHFLHLSPGLWVLAAPPWWVACKVCSWAPPHGQASLPRASSWRSGRRSPRQRNSPRPDRQHKN